MEASRSWRLPFPLLITVTTPHSHPTIQRLRADRRVRPLVAAHRGASQHHPENTLTAFSKAAQLGVALQEFDVRELACGELVCVHDDTFDRTTDASQRLGQGILVAETDLVTALTLDAGSWHQNGKPGEKVPTLTEALTSMLPTCVPLIEHKAGSAANYVACLRAGNFTDKAILQSFHWDFLAAVHQQAPEIAIGALGPTESFASPNSAAITAAKAFGAELIHWQFDDITQADADRVHDAGLLLCTYTTDDETGWLDGQALGIDAMCTNNPSAMMRALDGPSTHGDLQG